jgi:hypothetical protein
MQVAGGKAGAILGVGGGVSSAGAGAKTISVVKAAAEVGMNVGAEVGIATVREIRRTRTGLIVGVSGGFEIKGSSGKSLTLKEAGSIVTAGANVRGKREVWVKGFADACRKGEGGV